MKRIICLFFFVLILFTFTACDICSWCDEAKVTFTQETIYGTYARKNETFENDYFTITLNSDGSCSYYATLVSSYIGMGQYTVVGNIITLVDNNIPTLSGPHTCTFKFEYRDGKLIYLASESDEFMYIDLPEGAEFERVNIQENETE